MHSDTDQFSVSSRVAEIEAMPLVDRAVAYELFADEMLRELNDDGTSASTNSEN